MIHNFICVICNKFKSVGSPRKEDGKYICADCRRQLKMRWENGRRL